MATTLAYTADDSLDGYLPTIPIHPQHEGHRRDFRLLRAQTADSIALSDSSSYSAINAPAPTQLTPQQLTALTGPLNWLENASTHSSSAWGLKAETSAESRVNFVINSLPTGVQPQARALETQAADGDTQMGVNSTRWSHLPKPV